MQLGSTDPTEVRLLSTSHPTAFRSMMLNPEGELFGAINVLVAYTNVCTKDDVIYMNQYSADPGKVNEDPSKCTKRSVEWCGPLSTWFIDIVGPVSTSELQGQNFLCIGREDGAIFVIFCVEKTTEGRQTIRVFPVQRKNQVLSALMELTTWVLQMGKITTEFIMDSDRTQKAAVKVIKLAFPFLTVTIAAPNTVTKSHSTMSPLDAQVAYVFKLVNATTDLYVC